MEIMEIPDGRRKRVCSLEGRLFGGGRQEYHSQLKSIGFTSDDISMLDIDDITRRLQDARILSSFELLPTEILIKIFSNLVPDTPERHMVPWLHLMDAFVAEWRIRREALRSLCLTSRRIAAVVNPVLHQIVCINDWPTLLVILKQLMRHPNLQRSVRTVICSMDLRDYWSMYRGKEHGAKWLPTIFGGSPIEAVFETQVRTAWQHHTLQDSCVTRRDNLFMATSLQALLLCLPRISKLCLRLPRPTAAGTFYGLEDLWVTLFHPGYYTTKKSSPFAPPVPVEELSDEEDDDDDDDNDSESYHHPSTSNPKSSSAAGASALSPLPGSDAEAAAAAAAAAQPESKLGKRKYPHDTPYESTISEDYIPPHFDYPFTELKKLELRFDPETFNMVAYPAPLMPDNVMLELAVINDKKTDQKRRPIGVFRATRKLETFFSSTMALHRILVELQVNNQLQSINLRTEMIQRYSWQQAAEMLARGHDWNINKLLAACRSTLTEVHLDLLTCGRGGPHLYGPLHRLTCLAFLNNVTTMSVTLQGAFGTLLDMSGVMSSQGVEPLMRQFPASLVSLTIIEWWDFWVHSARYIAPFQEAPRHQCMVAGFLVMLPEVIPHKLPRLRHLAFVANPHARLREHTSPRGTQWCDTMSEDEYRLMYANKNAGLDFRVRMRLIEDGRESDA